MHQTILILDFGSQYTQLIARRIRELNVYCEIHPFNHIPVLDEKIKGVVLSGSPFSVRQADALMPELSAIRGKLPILAVCYGAQWLAHFSGGEVEASDSREYGRSSLSNLQPSRLFKGIDEGSQVWMSHGDSIKKIPSNAHLIASTPHIPVAAFEFNDEPTYAIQFHPEVTHSTDGKKLISNFLFDICNCAGDWTTTSFIDDMIAELRNKIGSDKVVLGLSGGVDSSVAALLFHKAIGKQLHCIFVDNGLLRLNEYKTVLESYQAMGLNVRGIDASALFLGDLNGVSDPEQKRKIIGKNFIEVFDQAAHEIEDVKWLAQGTIYPDVIESISVKGPSATIKSHHNVGGLPEKMKLKVVEPLKTLFKDEIRLVGKELGLKPEILNRHPFPGPGLAIRILGEITPEKVNIVQQADAIYIDHLKKSGLYDKIWQAGAIFIPVKSVGVMGDERSYEYTIALRAVTSVDGMTADWYPIPYEDLGIISNQIINKVRGVNRVVYDISSKPPATIEWE